MGSSSGLKDLAQTMNKKSFLQWQLLPSLQGPDIADKITVSTALIISSLCCALDFSKMNLFRALY